MFKKLVLGTPMDTTMTLLMANLPIKQMMWVLYVVLIRVDQFIFPTKFVILYFEIEYKVLDILGRTFFPKEHLLDVEIWDLKFWVNDNEVTFNIWKSIKQPRY